MVYDLIKKVPGHLGGICDEIDILIVPQIQQLLILDEGRLLLRSAARDEFVEIEPRVAALLPTAKKRLKEGRMNRHQELGLVSEI